MYILAYGFFFISLFIFYTKARRQSEGNKFNSLSSADNLHFLNSSVFFVLRDFRMPATKP